MLHAQGAELLLSRQHRVAPATVSKGPKALLRPRNSTKRDTAMLLQHTRQLIPWPKCTHGHLSQPRFAQAPSSRVCEVEPQAGNTMDSDRDVTAHPPSPQHTPDTSFGIQSEASSGHSTAWTLQPTYVPVVLQFCLRSHMLGAGMLLGPRRPPGPQVQLPHRIPRIPTALAGGRRPWHFPGLCHTRTASTARQVAVQAHPCLLPPNTRQQC